MRALLVIVSAICMLAAPVSAEEKYKMPPNKIAKVIDRPLTPAVNISPDATWLLVLRRPSMPSIDDLSARELRLAGRRIDPGTNGRSRDFNYYTKITWRRRDTLKQTQLSGLPDKGRIGTPFWSPDSSRIAFPVTTDKGIAMFVAEAGAKKAQRITDYVLNATTGYPCDWFSDNKTLLCKVIDEKRGAEPVEDKVPKGPVVQETSGKKAPARTYQDLLNNPHDEALFDYYFTSQLVFVTIDGKVLPRKIKGVIVNAETSPDGKHLLVERLTKPYSYLVPMGRFPLTVEVFDRKGKLVKKLADLPLADEIPIGFGSVREGQRGHHWRGDAPATIVWTVAQDGGDVKRKAKIRDRVFMHAAPFKGKPTVLTDLKLRYGGITWGSGELALVSEWWWKTRKTRTWIVAPDKPTTKARKLFDRSWEDRYADPGSPVTERSATTGASLLKTVDNKGKGLFLIGTGASPEGNRPFVDTINMEDLETKRLWRSEKPFYERPVRVLDPSGRYLLTSRESKQRPPNFYVRDLQKPKKSQLRRLTKFPHPTPELKGMKKQLIRYERDDGVKLTATLYLPPGYKKGKKLPMVMWAYPREFKDASHAGQLTDSPYRFSRVGWWSPVLWLLRGYAVLDGPTMPIIGEGKQESNDKFREQLVSSAKAAVDEVVRRGVADRNRIAIGGHSYGAFMTANLLAHSDLFRAGIARSGAYNRTLTPFGFQSEERTLWEAPEIYFGMSPFMHAEKIDEPLLLIHGEADNNSGTFPLQSKRLYAAVKGLGGTTRLVMLPHESHGYRARESIMHMLWETSQWLDKHVKKAKRKGKGKRKGKRKKKKK